MLIHVQFNARYKYPWAKTSLGCLADGSCNYLFNDDLLDNRYASSSTSNSSYQSSRIRDMCKLSRWSLPYEPWMSIFARSFHSHFTVISMVIDNAILRSLPVNPRSFYGLGDLRQGMKMTGEWLCNDHWMTIEWSLNDRSIFWFTKSFRFTENVFWFAKYFSVHYIAKMYSLLRASFVFLC